jgi:phosphoribosylformylglycinamidine cyclo-ligase
LLGGETAEMPGFYSDEEYDVAGFIVGVADRNKVIDGRNIEAGDVVLALPSLGLHTNGYSLARKLFLEIAGYEVTTEVPELGTTVGKALLQPHMSYLPVLTGLLDQGVIKGLAHITGGGLTDNIPRILPEGTAVQIRNGSWPSLPVFDALQKIGNVSEVEMYRTFNMGVGMVIICAQPNVEFIQSHIKNVGNNCYTIGSVISGRQEVTFI